MKTVLSFKDAQGDTVRFSPSAQKGDIYVEVMGPNSLWYLVRLEPAQIEALVDHLLTVLEEMPDEMKWPGYIEASVEA